MTKVEAVRVAGIMCTADGGCGSCAEALLKQLASMCPTWEQEIWEVFHKEFD